MSRGELAALAALLVAFGALGVWAVGEEHKFDTARCAALFSLADNAQDSLMITAVERDCARRTTHDSGS